MDEASKILFYRHFSHCTITESEPDSVTGSKYLVVTPIWNGVDRTNVGGWGVGLKDQVLAERLQRAIISGAAFQQILYTKDVNGKTYICATSGIYAKHLSAELRKLGY